MQPYSMKTAGGYRKLTYKNDGTLTGDTYSATFANYSYLTCSTRHGDFVRPTPFSYTKVNTCHLEGYANMKDSAGWRIERSGRGCGSSSLTAANCCLASALDPYNKTLGKLYDSIRSDVDLSIDIYQGMQTVKMVMDFYNTIRHPLDTFAKQANALVKRGGWRSSTKLAGSKWLEYQYGLRPTMGTIYDLTHDLVGAVCSDAGFQVVKARATTKDKNRTHKVLTAFHSVVPSLIESTDSRRCEIGVTYTIGNTTINALSQFTSLNPVSFIYENIPFSFVLDWAYDVGGYLRMMETALMSGLIFHSGYVSHSRLRKSRVRVQGYGVKELVSPSTKHSVDLVGDFEQVDFSRSILTSMPRPRAPQFNIQLGSERLLSAASLLTNLL